MIIYEILKMLGNSDKIGLVMGCLWACGEGFIVECTAVIDSRPDAQNEFVKIDPEDITDWCRHYGSRGHGHMAQNNSHSWEFYLFE